MTLTVTPVADSGGDQAPAPIPSRRQRHAAALDKVQKGGAPAAASVAAHGTVDQTRPTPAAAQTAQALTGATPAGTVGDPVTAPAPGAQPERPTDVQTAIQLERAQRDLEKTRGEVAVRDERLRALTEREAAAKKDPFRALQDAGHDIDEVMLRYVEGSPGPGKPATPGAQPAAGAPTELQQKYDDLLARFDRLEGSLRGAGEKYTRNQRLDNLRGLTKDGDDFEALRAMEAHELALADIEGAEAQAGSPLGDLELRESLKGFEKRTREKISAQLKALGNTKFARQTMQEILQAAVDSVDTTTPTVTGDGDSVPSTITSDMSGAMRSRPGLSREQLRSEARDKARAAMARRAQGLP